MFKSQNKSDLCRDFQINLFECIEAVGKSKGQEVCKDYLDDYEECRKTKLRFEALKEIERVKALKLARGELKAEDLKSDNVPCNSFVRGPYY